MTEGHNNSGGLPDIMSNRPFIVGLLFIGTYVAPFLILIGLPLAYVFKRRSEEAWEESHFQYLIRTFWLAILFALAAALLGIALAALIATLNNLSANGVWGFYFGYLFLVGAAALAFCGVRIIISLMKSAALTPISNPKTLWI